MAEASVAPVIEAGMSSAVAAAGTTAEGVGQSVGAVAETLEGAIPAAVVTETVDTGAEGVAQEGLAAGAQATLKTSGPDEALFYVEGTDTCEGYKKFYEDARMPDESPVIYKITQRFRKKNGEWVEFGGFRMEQMEKDEEYWRKKGGE